jgi:hypothetical protein
VVGLDITQELAKQVQRKILSQVPVLSLFYQIVVAMIIMIEVHRLAVPSISVPLGGGIRYRLILSRI